MSKPQVKLVKLGLKSYLPTWKIQQTLVEKVKLDRKRENYLVLVEHNPVYTTGIRTNVYDINEEKKLKNLGADFVRSNRGGLITFHGPGQLVAYPILDLNQFIQSEFSGKKLKVLGMKWYVNTLEEVVIQTLRTGFDIKAFRSPHTGVWVNTNNEKKICAMGVHNSDLVTSHGLALNCDIDLTWFTHIIPCGIEGKGVTSLSKEMNRIVGIQETQSYFLEQFEKHYSCEIVESEENI